MKDPVQEERRQRLVPFVVKPRVAENCFFGGTSHRQVEQEPLFSLLLGGGRQTQAPA